MMKTGVLVGLHDIRANLERVKSYGFGFAQICSWDINSFTPALAEEVKSAIADTGVAVRTFWCGWPGPASWTFYDGPLTLGLVPDAYRFERTQALLKGIEFAHQCGIKQVATHAGFIPEDMNDPKYPATLIALKTLVRQCKHYDMNFLFETGQETPATLLRTIEDLGGENVGINFDTGNLILYGKGNPADAIDVFGKYVRDFHCKDGLYPTDGRELGREVALGQGKADWRQIVHKMKALGYDGPLTIEREISGDQQTKDMLAAKEMPQRLIEEA